MSEMTVGDMSAQYRDVLKELGNIGAGNAATALAELLQSKVDMSVPQVKLINFSQIGEVIGGEEQVMAGMYLAIQKDITGSILFLVKEEVALHLVKKLMGDFAQDIHGEMEQSALKEISNIITGAYLNALSTMTGLRIEPSVPDLTIDMAGAILSVPAIELSQPVTVASPPSAVYVKKCFLTFIPVVAGATSTFGRLCQQE